MILEKVKKVIANQLSMEVDEINVESTFSEDLGVDSLEIFEIVMSLEEEFEIEIPNEDIENIKTIQDIVNYVKSKVEE